MAWIFGVDLEFVNIVCIIIIGIVAYLYGVINIKIFEFLFVVRFFFFYMVY